MFDRFWGTIVQKNPPRLVLRVGDVGYVLECPMSTFYQLPAENAQLTLFVKHLVRDDGQYLYGFYTSNEREFFNLLLAVHGVGPKLALVILSNLSIVEFIQAVQCNDSTSLERLPGVGKKTAARLVMESKDLLTKFKLNTALATTPLSDAARVMAAAYDDALAALLALGYKEQATRQVLANLLQQDGTSQNREALIRDALRLLV